MSDSITYLATTLSIIGGCIAIWQAYKATTEANRVEKYRDEIVSVRKAVDFSSIEATLSRTINLISKYGPASSESSLLGVNPQKDAEEVQNFITILRKNKPLFEGYFSEIDELCNEISTLVSELVNSYPGNYEEMKKKGTILYHRLTDFSPALKGNLDHLKEKRV